MSETAIEREGFEEAPEEETEETKEEEFKCSLEQMEAFLISSVWEELKSKIEGSVKLAQMKLEVERDSIGMYRAQGALEELRIMLNFPLTIRDTLRAERDIEEEKEKEKGEER